MKESTSQLFQLLNNSKSIDEFLTINQSNFVDMTFTELLSYYLTDKGYSKSQVLKEAFIDPNYGYQIFNGRRNPTRNKIIQLGLAMHLSLKEMQLLLLSGSEGQLYIRNRRDAIILYAIENHLNVMTLEELLINNGEMPLIKE